MMTDMDLVEFLTARLDEDEEAAREAGPRPWFSTDNYLDDANGGDVARFEIKADARHAGRHDPAHVLAECEAKRRVLQLVPEIAALNWTVDRDYATLGRLLHALALPYADHPDYRQE